VASSTIAPTVPGSVRRRAARAAGVSLSFLAVGLLALGSLSTASPATAGGAAAELNFQDGLNGVTAATKLSSFRGKNPVVLLFWLPICPACPPAAARAEALLRRYGARGLKVISVTHGKKTYVQEYLRRNGYRYGVGFDWQALTHASFGVTGLPTLILIGKDGRRIRYGNALEAAIERELSGA
jgi:peroxiredoxin